MIDGVTFEESVQMASKTIRQTPHSRRNITPFQLNLGRKRHNSCWPTRLSLIQLEKTLTRYILAQPTEVQVFDAGTTGRYNQRL